MLSYIKIKLKNIFNKFGYSVVLKSRVSHTRKGVNLNIGCGSYVIDGFISLDIYSDHYHGERVESFVKYDMREDFLPYQGNTVDNIYVSHVIEHIETDYVVRFINESYRVLRWGGCSGLLVLMQNFCIKLALLQMIIGHGVKNGLMERMLIKV